MQHALQLSVAMQLALQLVLLDASISLVRSSTKAA
jgi:hypothetical protein